MEPFLTIARLQGKPCLPVLTDVEWSPPSPDPSGITYLPGTNQLLIRDGDLPANLFEATLAGSVRSTAATLAFSREPVGVRLHPGNGHRCIADDDQRRVFEVDEGPDGRCRCQATWLWCPRGPVGCAELGRDRDRRSMA
jgi:hypothetical protein